MRGYAHSNCKYLRIFEMHDYHESKTVLTINDNHEFKGENVLDNWNGNLQSLNQEKNEASVPVFYADWTSVPVPQTSSIRGLDVGFIKE